MSTGFYDNGQPYSGPDVATHISRQIPKGLPVLLSFSCGKDSIALWLKLKEVFDYIIPFYMWLVPGLEFVEDSLRYYEQFFGTRILRVPHPSFYRMLNNFIWQTPERVAIIRAARLPEIDYDDITALITQQYQLPADTFTTTGIRAADSPNRRANIHKHGPINWTRRTFYPIWDMKVAELDELLTDSQIALPVDYEIFGRSFDGLDARFLGPIKEHFPGDYKKVLEWFPLAELELMRYEIGQSAATTEPEWRRLREGAWL